MNKKVDEKQERTWALFCHISALAGFIFPFGNIIAPLVIWLIKKEEYPLVDDQGKESVNFQIGISIAGVVSLMLTIVLIGIPLLIAVVIFAVVMVIIAAIRANEGEKYRYPLNLRLIK